MRVFRVTSDDFPDFIAKTWEEVSSFIHYECDPVHNDDHHGDMPDRYTVATVTAEQMTEEEYAALGEWSP